MKLGVSEIMEEEQLEISLQVTSEECVFRNYKEVNTEGDMQRSLAKPGGTNIISKWGKLEEFEVLEEVRCIERMCQS